MKARVISTYLDKELGQYVYPGSEVDLASSEFERLSGKGCVEGVEPSARVGAHSDAKPKKRRARKPKRDE